MSSPPTPRPAPDPVVVQRTLVYALTGLLVLAGAALVIAFKDPCARAEGTDLGLARCHASFGDKLPGSAPLIALGLAWVTMIVAYELRWYLRVWLPAALGAAQLVLAAVLLKGGNMKVLGVVNGVIGLALLASAWGLHKQSRGAWSFAVSACGTLAIVYFFGSARVRSATGWHLAWAVLPSLAVFLPATVGLATSPPGAPRYAPFAKTPTKTPGRP